MATIKDGFIVCDKEDPLLRFRIPAELREWIREAAKYRGVTMECLILETLYDNYHRIRDTLVRRPGPPPLNSLEKSRRVRLHWEVYHITRNQRLTEETHVRLTGEPRPEHFEAWDVLRAARAMQWKEYRKLRTKNLEALEKIEFDITKQRRKRKPRRTPEQMEQDRNNWEHVMTPEERAKGVLYPSKSTFRTELWLRSRAKPKVPKD